MHLPEAFETYTRTLMGNHLYDDLVQALQDEPVACIRLNRQKCPSAQVAVPHVRVPWCDQGYRLACRPAFTFDPLLHAGAYYVQEPSSMFLSAVLRQYVREPVKMLDLCAAPGGKSTLARAELPEGSVLMCNEPVRNRAQVLAENVQKWGHPDVIVTNNYPADYRKAGLRFDVILCDAPCSGEGMFRKNGNAIGEWSEQNVENCARLQRDIVADAWECLEAGGLMIYSTCTFNAKENEENVAWICSELGAKTLSIDTETHWVIAPTPLHQENQGSSPIGGSPHLAEPLHVYRFIPGYHNDKGKQMGEGLFMAVLRKDGERKPDKPFKQQPSGRGAKGREAKSGSGKDNNMVREWVLQPDSFCYIYKGDELLAMRPPLLGLYEKAASQLRVLSAGICLGQQKGKNWIPSESLALSTCLNPATFPKVELSHADALNYLRSQAIALPADTPRGFILVTYRGLPLGFMKNIGNRANNLYPNEWRIKSQYNPEEEPHIIDIE